MPQLATPWCSQKLNLRKTKIPEKSINQLGWLGAAVRICILKWNVQCFLLPPASMNAPWSMLAWGGRKVSCMCVHTHSSSFEIFSTGGSSFFFFLIKFPLEKVQCFLGKARKNMIFFQTLSTYFTAYNWLAMNDWKIQRNSSLYKT